MGHLWAEGAGKVVLMIYLHNLFADCSLLVGHVV